MLNLVPNKDNVFVEIYRVLKPGGHFSISDVVLVGELPEQLKAAAEMYAGCVSGAIQREDYYNLIHKNGFKDVMVQKQKPTVISGDILLGYLNEAEIEQFRQGSTRIQYNSLISKI